MCVCVSHRASSNSELRIVCVCVSHRASSNSEFGIVYVCVCHTELVAIVSWE